MVHLHVRTVFVLADVVSLGETVAARRDVPLASPESVGLSDAALADPGK